MRRIERLINLVAALLETRRPLTAEEIRDQIAGYDQPNQEAFRRAFERDKEALRAMGIPLELRKTAPFGDGPEGYLIPKERYYLPELDLEPDELAALRIAAEAVLGAGDQAEAGLMKLSVDEPVSSWGGPRVVWGADVAAEEPLLGPLYTAVLDHTPISFTYETSAGEVGTRAVEPYGLVHRRGHWYVVGRDRERDDFRSFKASRISGVVTTLEGTYEIPADFDASRYVAIEPWELGQDEPQEAVVRFHGPLRWWPQQNMRDLPQHDAPDGSVDVQMPVSNPDALVSWVIGFGGDAEVVSPAALRERVREHLRRWLEAEVVS